jgi:hypothetical protein
MDGSVRPMLLLLLPVGVRGSSINTCCENLVEFQEAELTQLQGSPMTGFPSQMHQL